MHSRPAVPIIGELSPGAWGGHQRPYLCDIRSVREQEAVGEIWGYVWPIDGMVGALTEAPNEFIGPSLSTKPGKLASQSGQVEASWQRNPIIKPSNSVVGICHVAWLWNKNIATKNLQG